LLLGVTIGVLFYPTKRVEEKLTQKYEQQISALKQEHQLETQKLTENYNLSLKEASIRLEETQKKVSSLTVQIKELKSNQKTAKFKIVRPDGTIEEKEFTETQTEESSKVISQIQEEFKTKVTQIEQKWSDIHRQRVTEIKKEFDRKESEYKNTIATLEKEKKVTTNDKRFGLEVGIMTDKNYYGHGTMDVWGPTFIGVHGQFGQNNQNNQMGVGIGIRF
jgi:hypothetical protein